MSQAATVLVIACGAIAHEVMALRKLNRWDHLKVQCLPADLHNRPAEIPGRVRALIDESAGRFEKVFVAYGDCGTGGALDAVLREVGIERIPGAHCYQFYAGHRNFEALAEEEPGTFYLTDFLARNFERLVIGGLGLDRHPELRDLYFGNYRRLVHLAQTASLATRDKAREAALRLGLGFEYRFTGYGDLVAALSGASVSTSVPITVTRVSHAQHIG